MVWRGKSVRPHASPEASADRVDDRGPMGTCMSHMVGNKKGMPAEKYTAMKIMQDEIPAKETPRVPERVWNPTIQIIIRIWGRIVGNYRRAFTIIIIVDNFSIWVRGVITHLCIFAFWGWPSVRGS